MPKKIIYADDAIDALDIGCELLRRALDDTDVVGVERAKYEWGLGLIESYIADIKELPSAQPEQRWIPCSERLPEENGQYLITVKYEHVDDYEDIYSEHGEWVDGKWDMFSFGHCGKVENIIAWMPLPEPYKGEQ